MRILTRTVLLSLLAAAPARAVTPTGGAGSPATAAAAPRLSIKEVVEHVQKRYDAAKDFRARFNQTLTNAAFGRKSSFSGEVLLKKPGRMRWNYEKPEPKMYLSDGNTLWLYEPEDKQAFKQDLKSSQLPSALAFLAGQGKLAAEFDVTAADAKSPYGTPRDYVLLLSPKTPQAQVKTILFVVDPKTYDVRESVITDQQGNVNDLLFSEIRTNTSIPDGQFKWSPPAGVRLIDTAKLGR